VRAVVGEVLVGDQQQPTDLESADRLRDLIGVWSKLNLSGRWIILPPA